MSRNFSNGRSKYRLKLNNRGKNVICVSKAKMMLKGRENSYELYKIANFIPTTMPWG